MTLHVEYLTQHTCPACGGGRTEDVLRIDAIPVFCNVLHNTADAARRAPTGTMDLVSCSTCGLLFNAAFDPDLVTYAAGYENALHFSPTFQRYEDALARRLIDTYGLHDAAIVEVGSGDGEFLTRICELSDSHGTGFDPSFDPASDTAPESQRVRIESRPLTDDADHHADLVICRHVLEHVDDPGGLLTSIRDGVSAQHDGRFVAYFEVPDAIYMVEHTAVWDLIYEHYTYWSLGAIERLLAAAEFSIIDQGESFGGQYLWVDATPAVDDSSISRLSDERAARFAGRTTTLDERFAQTATRWRDRIDELSHDRTVVIWGAGSKGVTFANIVGLDPSRTQIVDINPRKHGRHVPGTGHAIMAPSQLPGLGRVHVLLMNAMYQDEVRKEMTRVGANAELEVVS